MTLLNIPRTPWKMRLARNANEIDVKHVDLFIFTWKPRGNIEMQDFLNFVGLKATKTALVRAGVALRKAGRMA